MSPLFAGAVGGNQHAGRVEHLRVGPMKPNLGCGRASRRVRIQRGHQFAHPGGRGNGVVVEDGDVCGGRLARGQIYRGTEADVTSRVQDGRIRAREIPWPGSVHEPAAAVIDDHNSKIPKQLPVQALDTFPQRRSGGERRNNDGDP